MKNDSEKIILDDTEKESDGIRMKYNLLNWHRLLGKECCMAYLRV